MRSWVSRLSGFERAARILDAHEVFHGGDEVGGGAGLESGGELREIVEEDVAVKLGGDGAGEGGEVVLCVREEVRHGEQERGGSGAEGDAAEVSDLALAGGSDAGEEGGAVAGDVGGDLEDGLELGGGGHGELAGGTIEGEAPDSCGDEKVERAFEGVGVDLPLHGAGSERGGKDSLDWRGHWHLLAGLRIAAVGRRTRSIPDDPIAGWGTAVDNLL